MQITKIIGLGDFSSNAYIVSSGEQAVLIDAPCEPEYITEKLQDKKLAAILLTHGHVDHISAAAKIKELTGCKVYISQADSEMLTSSKKCLADRFRQPFYPCEESISICDGDKLTFGDMTFNVITTPGHTQGSVCYMTEDFIFSGDTLFKQSIGRNFGCSAYSTIIDSIAKLYKYNKNYIVLPGHGEETDLYSELEENPFLGELRTKL